MKKFVSIICLTTFLLSNIAYAKNVKNVEAYFSTTPKAEYKYKTVKKHYTVYDVNIRNNNSKPLLLSANTEVLFIQKDGTEIKSDNRRKIYRKSRKRDMGRYYGFAIPGALLAGGITGITFLSERLLVQQSLLECIYLQTKP